MDERKGTLAGISCYVLWGLFPLYWMLLDNCASSEVICHRIIWCFITTALVCKLTHVDFLSLVKDRRGQRFLIPAAVLITANWSIYIVAVQTGHVLEASIGYYINPLVSILLGVAFFHEKLSKFKLIAVALCALGVLSFTVNYGSFPWIALLLAFTFGAYGAVKKRAGYPAVQALAAENTFMVLPALAAAFFFALATGNQHFFADTATLEGWKTTVLLIVAGPVTAIPLILFAKAANSIPLSLLGFIQYISPTLSLLCGVFFLGEAFTTAHALCLGCIWIGLALVSAESLLKK